MPLGRALARVLAPEPLPLHLCAHRALHHNAEGLPQLYDVALLVARRRSHMDWDGALQAVRRL